MNRRQIVIFAAILAVLIAGVTLKRFRTPPELTRRETKPLSLSFDSNKLEKIEIKKGDGSIQLLKQNGNWVLPALWTAKADAKKIERFLKSVLSTHGEERGWSQDLFSDFGIKDEEAVHLIFSAKETPLLHMLVGIKQTGRQDIFIRKSGENTVFLSDTPLLADMGLYGELEKTKLETNFWADLNLFSLDPEKIKQIEIREKNTEWHESGAGLPFEKDGEKMKSFFRELTQMKASGLADPNGKEYGFDAPDWEARITLTEGDPVIMTVGGLKPGSAAEERYVRTSNSTEIYSVSKPALEQIKTDGSQWIISNPLGIEKGELEKLTIHAGTEEVSVTPKTESWPELDEYLNSLSYFSIVKVLGETKQLAEPTVWLEIKPDGKEALRVICQKPDEKTQEVLCVNGGNPTGFYLARYAFDSIFSQLDRLKKPAA